MTSPDIDARAEDRARLGQGAMARHGAASGAEPVDLRRRRRTPTLRR